MDTCVLCVFYSKNQRQKPGQSTRTSKVYKERKEFKKSRWGRSFSASVQTGGPGAHPASCAMGTTALSGEYKFEHPPPSSADIKNDRRCTFTPLSATSTKCTRGPLPLQMSMRIYEAEATTAPFPEPSSHIHQRCIYC
jgi:hypothetical protein